MLRSHSRLLSAFIIAATAFGSASAAQAAANPFFSPSTLPFGAPQFDKIKDGDFQPAFEAGMTRQRAEVAAIANNTAPATFENTIVALEKSGRLLDRVSNVFYALAQANTDPALQKVEEYEAPRLAAHQDAIYLNAELFARVQKIYDARATLKLDPESRQLLEVYYQQFVRSGAKLSAAGKAKLSKIDEQLSTLQAAFDRKLLAGTAGSALIVDDKAKLAGLSDGAVASAASAADARGLKGKWLIPLQNTTQQPALTALQDRSVRQQLFQDSWTRTSKGGGDDTRDTIAAIAQLRAQKAQLLGYADYASYVLEDQMAKTPATVENFLGELIGPTTTAAETEAKSLQAIVAQGGQNFQLAPWDWQHYAEKLRKAQYNLDENEVRPYFELDNVLKNGLFYAANQLYGLTFQERKDIPVYQSDVRVFEVFDKDKSPLGLIYFDYFKRDNKAGGAWMSNFVAQSKLLGTKPVIYNVANFAKPAPGQPALLTFSEVTGMFHEFGHALHGFFANEEYPTLSGTNVARDFVEFPSQFNEHWALYPAVLKHYAVNYKTGAPMPQALIDKIQRASKFNNGYAVGEALAASELDMQWHTLPASAPKQNVDTFETEALKKTRMDLADVPPRYRSSYFLHIWSNGYAAGYYAYLWTEMLDDDVYQWFIEHGGLTRANGQRLRDLILSRGHTEDYGTMFRAFYGKDPDIGPMLQQRGFVNQ